MSLPKQDGLARTCPHKGEGYFEGEPGDLCDKSYLSPFQMLQHLLTKHSYGAADAAQKVWAVWQS